MNLRLKFVEQASHEGTDRHNHRTLRHPRQNPSRLRANADFRLAERALL
jgi:hypothetical protein